MLKLAVIKKVAGFVEARFGKKELIDILTDKDVNKNIENSIKVYNGSEPYIPLMCCQFNAINYLHYILYYTCKN